MKPKVYLDSSVVSHYYADDRPWRRDITRKLWEQLKQGEHEVAFSPVVFEEINKCKTQEEKDVLYNLLNELNFTLIEETDETLSLSDEYMATGVLPQRAKVDSRHIAVASVYGCKYILSWNMKHFVRRATMEMVQEVNGRLGIFQPNIQTPAVYIGEGDEEDE
ncbi:MAG: PIN domain-containing protein [Clostridiales bacterium]|jgi:predicted nucleic acid-binding protein|nr:PIN domain-containing protein [Clostridiales bacterium]